MSPGGDDSGPGTYQQPFKTLARAVEVSKDEDHIVLLKGSYLGKSLSISLVAAGINKKNSFKNKGLPIVDLQFLKS